MAAQFMLRNTPVSFLHVFEKHKASEDATAKFSVELIPLTTDPQLPALRQVCLQEAIAVFGAEKGPRMQIPIKTADEVNDARMRKGKDPRTELTGRVLIRCSEAGAVVLSDERGNAVYNTANDLESKAFLEDLKTRMFSGCICNALIEVYGYNQDQNPGVFASLKGLQLVRSEGDGVIDFGGGRPAALDVFGPVPGAAAQPSYGQPVGTPSLDDLI